MHVRLLALAVALVIVAQPRSSSAQCVPFPSANNAGCGPPPGSRPSLVCTSLPIVGGTLGFCVTAPSGASWTGPILPVLLLGACSPSLLTPPPIPFLCNLQLPLGSTCLLVLDPTASVIAPLVTGVSIACPFAPSGANSYSGSLFAIPPDPALAGLSLCMQAAGTLVTPSTSACIAVSDGLQVTIL